VPRRLGQHFLTDPRILDRIVDALDPDLSDDVLEIGPGYGALTSRLAPRVHRVVAIEKDRALAAVLRSSIDPATIVEVIAADALRENWPARLAPATAFKVVGNIPYYITSPLLDKALTAGAGAALPTVIVFLMQEEVADRAAAAPGSKTYGALSVGLQVTAHVDRVFGVKAGAFRPPPKVDSAVLRLRPRANPAIGPEDARAFRRFVTALFGQRRRQLTRGLMTVTGRSRATVLALIDAIGLDPTLRPEVVAPEGFVDLFRAVARLTAFTGIGRL